MTSAFIQLMQIALSQRDSLDEPLTEEQWEVVFKQARKQALIGVIFKALMSLPKEQAAPRKVKVQFALLSETIQQKNQLANAAIVDLKAAFQEISLRGEVIKGQTIAALYPWPDFRQSGDIDIWVKGDRREILKALRSKWKTGRVCYHHVDIDPFSHKPDVEVHFTPTWMNNPFTNRTLQAFFESSSVDVPFNLVFIPVHIYRHLLFEGVGLRQLMDYYYVLLHSDVGQREEAFKVLRSLKMEKFSAALLYVLKELFLLDDCYLYTRPSKVCGKAFIREISLSGNFGRYDQRNAHSKNEGLPARFLRRERRLLSFLRFYPDEVLWAPAFKIWQFFWRKQL